jgi:hypothetical protein
LQAKKDTLKENCKKLSSRLEKAVAAQAMWAMPDAGFRAYLLERKVAGSVLPLYSEFWREFDYGLKNLHKYVKCVICLRVSEATCECTFQDYPLPSWLEAACIKFLKPDLLSL